MTCVCEFGIRQDGFEYAGADVVIIVVAIVAPTSIGSPAVIKQKTRNEWVQENYTSQLTPGGNKKYESVENGGGRKKQGRGYRESVRPIS